ncbi:MAG: ribose 5-phosphate isomerase [Sulfuricurvum sp. PC08-66]|nr:MAG: ribose 5-phosphate isomerase [Sulfuricurvum sp. PC08-66]
MRYYIGTDHAGLELKNYTKSALEVRGFEVIDLSPATTERVDYPDFAGRVAQALQKDPTALGVLICGTGIGMSIAANKYNGIRAALTHDAYTAKMAREHNDANILCFGERVVGKGVVDTILDAWCASDFEGGRHTTRVDKINAIKG